MFAGSWGQPRERWSGGGYAVFGPDYVHARVPDLSFFDLSLRWNLSDRLQVTGIVNNLFDKYPPQTLTGTLEQSNTNAVFFSPLFLGRSYSIQAKVRF